MLVLLPTLFSGTLTAIEIARNVAMTLLKVVGLVVFAAVVGPGLIAGEGGNDAAGIWTYSVVGARFGYSMLWAMIPITASLIAVTTLGDASPTTEAMVALLGGIWWVNRRVPSAKPRHLPALQAEIRTPCEAPLPAARPAP